MSGMGGHSGTQWCGKEGGGHQLRMIEEKLNKARLLADKTPIFQDQILDETPMLDKPNTLLVFQFTSLDLEVKYKKQECA